MYFADALKDIEGGLEVANVKDGQFQFNVSKVAHAFTHVQRASGAWRCFVEASLTRTKEHTKNTHRGQAFCVWLEADTNAQARTHTHTNAQARTHRHARTQTHTQETS